MPWQPPTICPATPPPSTAYAPHWPPCSAVSGIYAGPSAARASGSARTRPMPNGTDAPERIAWPRRGLPAPPGRLRTVSRTCAPARGHRVVRGGDPHHEREAKQRIANAVQALPAAGRARDELHDLRVRAEEDEKRLRGNLADQETAVIDTGSALRGALGRPEVVLGAGLDRSSLPEYVSDEPGTDVRSRLRALRALADTVEQALGRPKGEVSDSTLLNRHTELRDQLAGGFDAQLEERDGIKVCRLVDDHGSHDVAAVGERIAVQAAEARGRLTAREREVFQRFLTGELGDHLSAQVITAANLVAALNDTLRTVRTSHGLGVELLWKLDEDVDADVRAAVELLRSPSSLRTREQTEQLREVLQRRIEDARRARPVCRLCRPPADRAGLPRLVPFPHLRGRGRGSGPPSETDRPDRSQPRRAASALLPRALRRGRCPLHQPRRVGAARATADPPGRRLRKGR